jgi:hypothetical protein
MSTVSHRSPEVDRCLRTAGWTPSRQVETSGWLTQLSSEGYTVVAAARPILQSLGGLTIFPVEEDDQAFTPQPFDFCPLDAGSGQRDLVELWEKRLGQPLLPLGQAFGYMTLLVAGDGRILAGETDTLHLIGQDIDEALEVMITAKRAPTVLA